jgi:poly(3-hydroxybutyrate) depolymerase
MPASFMDCFAPLTAWLQAARIPLAASVAVSEMTLKSVELGFDLTARTMKTGFSLARRFNDGPGFCRCEGTEGWMRVVDDVSQTWTEFARAQTVDLLNTVRRRRSGELDFIDLFIDPAPSQTLACRSVSDLQLLLDLPSLRLWDLSTASSHAVGNFTVVFAPRAGHHSNIAERTALFLREHGLSRMALVEQKCADEIPLFVDGRRHREDFDGQVEQYRRVLAHLKAQTGKPSHLVAVCQPGPLLMATLILHPDLGRTFGSAGAPMHTEGQSGFLTDFARTMGPSHIDLLLSVFGRTVGADCIGKGRQVYDGRLQVFGFYLLGLDQHLRNFKQLLADLRSGNLEGAERQKTFYQWYNYVHHFPAGFIRDTFQKIFVGNELIRGKLTIGGRTIGIKDYPSGVPIWALGGKRDDIAPEGQAVGHLPLIENVPEADKLSLSCDGGHMALVRSERVLNRYYTQIADFLLAHSD